MIRDLIAGLDVLDRPNLDDVFDEIDLGIRSARMIDIARPVSAAGPVDRPAVVDLEQVPGIEMLGFGSGYLPADVSDGDSLAGMRLECLVDGDVPMMIDRRRGTVSQMRARSQFARDELGN